MQGILRTLVEPSPDEIKGNKSKDSPSNKDVCVLGAVDG
jgi:hypothetical protein